jgi:hypothetical protein
MQERMARRGGYSPSEYDGRDVHWRKRDAPRESIQLFRPALRDQGSNVDCCTSMALATAFEIVDQRDGQSTRLSALHHYYFARRDPRRLGLVTMREALDAGATAGFCSLGLHDVPATAEGALRRPSAAAVADAENRRLLAYDANSGTAGYWSLDGLDRALRWKAALCEGRPLVVGLWTQSSYWAGFGMMINQSEAHRGAHAVCVVGFDDRRAVFVVRDSRGYGFANNGEWDLAYSVVSTGRIIESWIINTLTYDD